MTRPIALLTLCTLPLLGACIGVDGNGHRARETRDERDFVRIENVGQLDVQVRQGEEFAVLVSIDENLLDNVRTHVRDETLIIDNEPHLFDVLPGPHVLVTMPHFIFGKVDGSGNLDARVFDERETVRLEVSGSGDATFEGSAPRIEADVSGSGDLRLAGSTGFAQLFGSGSGDIAARDLDADAARLRTTGSGNITATVHGDVEAETSGSGDIELYGSPHVTSSHEHGSGDIHEH
jgi:hypothetical protein